MNNKYLFLFLLLFIKVVSPAQEQVLESIVAIVGEQIIMKSDIQIRKNQIEQQGVNVKDDCQVFESLLQEKLFLNQAILDSVEVSEDEVSGELERRIRYFISVMGSKEKLEEFYGKSVVEIKDEFRIEIRKQLLVNRIQQQITSGVDASPSEVKAYFNSLPTDSVPLFNTVLEVGQIAIVPDASAQEDSIARAKATELKSRALNGEDFSTLALMHSEDPGSAKSGGDLGFQERGTFVPEFEEMAYKLKPGEISDLVKTQFGYHILQGIERRGESVRVKHILVKPRVTSAELKKANQKLDSIRLELEAGNISFQKAVRTYSNDEMTKSSGGMLMNNETASTYFESNQMDPKVYFVVEKLQPGQYSKVNFYQTYDGSKGMRILYLKSMIPQHKASLTTDYDKIKSIVVNEKKQAALDAWFKKRIQKNYIKIDEAYKNCSTLL